MSGQPACDGEWPKHQRKRKGKWAQKDGGLWRSSRDNLLKREIQMRCDRGRKMYKHGGGFRGYLLLALEMLKCR